MVRLQLFCGLVAAGLFLSGPFATGGIAVPFDLPPVFQIEGYLDRAPDDAKVIDRVHITAPGKRTRELLVTNYRAIGGVLLDRYLSRELFDKWSVSGDRSAVARLLEAPAGARVAGTFVVYTKGYPTLVVAQLDLPS
jgi:hypothetical protein